MKIIKLELDFLIGPIVKEEFSFTDDKLITGIQIIDNDYELNDLNDKASALYSSFYEFNDDEPCKFNYEVAKEHLNELKELIIKIKNRLNILNDGTYEVEDMITDHLNSLS